MRFKEWNWSWYQFGLAVSEGCYGPMLGASLVSRGICDCIVGVWVGVASPFGCPELSTSTHSTQTRMHSWLHLLAVHSHALRFMLDTASENCVCKIKSILHLSVDGQTSFVSKSWCSRSSDWFFLPYCYIHPSEMDFWKEKIVGRGLGSVHQLLIRLRQIWMQACCRL